MYARALRTIYLRAIKAGIAEMKLYPFGMEKEGKYDPPNVRRVNHPLLKDEIQMLIDAKPESYDQMKARDYFLFAYYGGGMNMADILRLKWGDLTADTISFYRKKTKSTRQANLMPVSIPLNDITSAIIQRHGNDRKGADDYIFPVLNRLDEYAGKGKMKGDWREALIKNHTRYVNQHIKKLAKAIGIRIEIFSQRARYSFADHTRNADIPIDVRMSMMGQDNEKTHRIYLSTIPDAMTREAVNQALVSPKKKGNGKD
jgi:integrase